MPGYARYFPFLTTSGRRRARQRERDAERQGKHWRCRFFIPADVETHAPLAIACCPVADRTFPQKLAVVSRCYCPNTATENQASYSIVGHCFRRLLNPFFLCDKLLIDLRTSRSLLGSIGSKVSHASLRTKRKYLFKNCEVDCKPARDEHLIVGTANSLLRGSRKYPSRMNDDHHLVELPSAAAFGRTISHDHEINSDRLSFSARGPPDLILVLSAIVSRSTGKDSVVMRRPGRGRRDRKRERKREGGKGRRETSFANLRGKCRFQVASRAQLPGTGWARAGMKFRLVQQEQAKCAHPLRSARPGELSFATRERESPGERGDLARRRRKRRREREGKGAGGREREETFAGWMGWCNAVIANNGATMRVHVSRADREIDLRKETPVRHRTAIGRCERAVARLRDQLAPAD